MARLEWDPVKNRINFRKHGVSFETAALAFEDPLSLTTFDRQVGSEERWHTIGKVGKDLLLLVVHTVREEEDTETFRIISARKATPSERRHYEEAEY
ncbi:MAG: BrnT family toxin [Pseudomonadota bacterium]